MITPDYIYKCMAEFTSNIGWIDIGEKSEVLGMLAQTNLVCVGEDGKGVLVGIVNPCLFNPSVLVGYELMWWVEPKHRGTKFSVTLPSLFEDACKQLGAQKVIMSAIERSNDMAIKLYPRLGYEQLETLFLKEI